MAGAAVSRSGSISAGKVVNLDERLFTGEKFLKWVDQDSVPTQVTVAIDRHGFFLYYTDQEEIFTLDMGLVRDVRTGTQARIPKDSKLRQPISKGNGTLEDRTVTIVHGTDFANISYTNFCTFKVEVALFWATELGTYIRSLNPLSVTASQNLRKLHTQLLLSAKEDKKIPVRAITKLLAANNNKEDRRLVERALDQSGLPCGKADEIGRASFTFNQFRAFYLNLVGGRGEVRGLFEGLCKSEPAKKLLTAKEFLDFINNHQRDPRLNEILHPYATEEKALSLIRKHEPNSHLASLGLLSGEGFLWFLLSEDNNVISQEKLDKKENMERPLAHYFINSSHNTYLDGHQITGRASLEMYRQVLLSGCRCIELDFWNGQKEDEEPHITHGYTLVTKMSAKDVLQTIALYAFKTTDYPLILSFENHCNPKQQAKIAKYCEEFFGPSMLQLPLPDYPLERDVPLPPPSLLRGKILIKNKKQHHHANRNQSSPKLSSLPSPTTAAAIENGFLVNNNNNNNSDSSDDDGSESEDESDNPERQPKDIVTSDAGTAGKESQASAEISALVNYVQPVHFRSFEHAEKRKRSYEMSSFVETNALALLKLDPVEFVKYNKFQLSRVYPKGTRVDSSNFLPHIFWNAGCQLVALNYQTLDVPMQLNLGIFQYNQRTGYLLKPDVLCRDDRKFDPFTQSSVDNIVPGALTIQILSGQFLTDKRVGTYVEVEMYGLPCDTVRRGRFRTRTVSNGLSPLFNEEPFVFPQIILPDLAVLRVAAYEEGSRLIGHRVFPVSGLCPGLRHIPLFNESGQSLHMPCLFVSIEVKDYVPNSMNMYAEALANPIKYQQNILEERARALEVMADEEQQQQQSQQHQLEDDEPDEGGSGRGEPELYEDSSTPEYASPTATKSTIEILKRTGSNKPGGPKASERSPVLGLAARTDSAKNLAAMKGEEKASASLETIDLTPETVDEILEHKSVKEKQAELLSKLDQLNKKLQKDLIKLESSKTNQEEKLNRVPSRSKNPLQHNSINKIVKKFSTVNLDSSAQEKVSLDGEVEAKLETLNRSHNEKAYAIEKNYIQAEKEIREKCLESVFLAAEKSMAKSHANQLKCLEALYKKENSEVMKRIEVENRTQDGKMSGGNVSKEDIQREKREMLVKKGVQERGKLEELYTVRRNELVSAQGRRRLKLKEEWDRRREETDREFKRKQEELERRYARAH